MFGPTKAYFIGFGSLTVAGGVMAYIKVSSAIWLIAGGISFLFLVTAFLLPNHIVAGLIIGAVVSVLLVGYFRPAFFRTGTITPAGMVPILSIPGVVFAVLAWIRE
jgi:uncharacterized membrane protein (UPF0136 family)